MQVVLSTSLYHVCNACWKISTCLVPQCKTFTVFLISILTSLCLPMKPTHGFVKGAKPLLPLRLGFESIQYISFQLNLGW